MKWGVRRYQDKGGRLTRAGKERYNPEIDKATQAVSVAKKEYKKYHTEDKKRLLRYAKEDLRDTKTQIKLKSKNKVPKRQNDYVEKYTSKGMTREEAELAAHKRVRTERIIAVTAGVALTAAVAYVGYKHYDENVDQFIKSGAVLRNVSNNSNRGVLDAFYAWTNRTDDNKYRGIYGDSLQFTNPVYEAKIGVNSDLKVASKKTVVSALTTLVNEDPNYMPKLKEEIDKFVDLGSYGMILPKQKTVFDKAQHALSNGKIDANVHDAVNIALADHDVVGAEVSRKLYETLKSKGYDAIIDVNDTKYSGYNSKKPVIVFNGDSTKISVDSTREVDSSEIANSKKKAETLLVSRVLAKDGVKIATGVGAAKFVTSIAKTRKNDIIVKEYREKHPNTKLSYKEIVREYEDAI